MSSAILKSFSWCSPSIEKLCGADPDFANYLISQTQEQRQCLVFVILGWERLGSARIAPAKLARKIRTKSKKALLKEYCKPCPAGLVTALKKLGNRVMIKDRYLGLINLLAEPNAAKFLWHEVKIQPFSIDALVGMEPVYRRPSIIRNIANKSALNSFQYAIAVARRANPKASDSALAKSLEEKLSNIKKHLIEVYDISWLLQEWLANRLKKTVIPEPPWEGTQKLRPIADCQGILKIATDFENCLESELAKVIAKKRYFYIWKDRGTAVVALDNEPLLGWIVGDIKGPQNKTVSRKTKENIIGELHAAGIDEYQGAQEFNLYD